MAWTTPSSQSQGDLISLATWNANVVANPQYLYDNNGILDAKVGYSLISVAATFSFTSIPSSYDGLLILLQLRGDTAATSTTVNMRFNNDTGNNYAYQRILSASTTVTGAASTGTSTFPFGSVPAASATAGWAGAYKIFIPGYARTTLMKNIRVEGGGHDGTNYQMSSLAGQWLSTAAITRIDIYPGAGSWEVGSECAIFATQSV